MKTIKVLAESIREEQADARKYAKLALQHREDDRPLSDTFRQLAEQELEHSNRLHAQAARIIGDYKAKGHEAPAAMQAVWEWEHERMIEEAAHTKALLQELKG